MRGKYVLDGTKISGVEAYVVVNEVNDLDGRRKKGDGKISLAR